MPKQNINSPHLLLTAFGYELLGTILKYPVVYYTTGLRHVAGWAREKIAWYEKFFAIRLSYKTLLTPLYGDYTRSGLAVGIFLRFFLALSRTFMFLLACLFILAAFAFYGFAPIIFLYFLFNPPHLSLLV